MIIIKTLTNMKVAFKRWNPRSLKQGQTVMIMGRRGVGKTNLQENILSEIAGLFEYGVAMTPTVDTIMSWKKHMPVSCIYSGYTVAAVNVMLQMQQQSERPGSKKPKSVFLLLDDCMYKNDFMKSPEMREIMMNGRHKNIFFMNTVQNLMDIPCGVRDSFDYIITLQENNLTTHKKNVRLFLRRCISNPVGL